MCCFFTSLMLFGPRIAIIVWYLYRPIYVTTQVGSLAGNGYLLVWEYSPTWPVTSVDIKTRAVCLMVTKSHKLSMQHS